MDSLARFVCRASRCGCVLCLAHWRSMARVGYGRTYGRPMVEGWGGLERYRYLNDATAVLVSCGIVCRKAVAVAVGASVYT